MAKRFSLVVLFAACAGLLWKVNFSFLFSSILNFIGIVVGIVATAAAACYLLRMYRNSFSSVSLNFIWC